MGLAHMWLVLPPDTRHTFCKLATGLPGGRLPNLPEVPRVFPPPALAGLQTVGFVIRDPYVMMAYCKPM